MAWLQSLTPIDYVMIGVIVMALLIGWARGFVEVLSGFLVFLVTTFVAGHYTGAVVNILNRMWGLQERLAGWLAHRLNLPPESYRIPASAIPVDKALEWIRAVPLPPEYKLTLAQRITEWSHTGGNQSAAEFIINQLAAGVLSAIVFIVLASILSWVLTLAVRLVSDQIKEIPLIGPADRLLGSVTMGLEAVVVLALIVGLLGPALSMYGGQKLGNAIQTAQLTPYFLTIYHWLRNTIFGMDGGPFFIS